jgi:hypothetical protein
MRHPRRQIRGHEGESAVGLQHRVHDLVGHGGVLVAELAERVHPQVTAEDGPVELHRVPRVAGEVEVGIQPRGHDILLDDDLTTSSA